MSRLAARTSVAAVLLVLASVNDLRAQERASFDCIIEPSEVVQVGVPVGGVVAEMTVDRGDPVKQGQLLARLDSRVEEANAAVARQRAAQRARLEAADTRMAFSERKYKRALDLSAKKFISGNEVDEAETERELARLEKEEATEDLQLAKLELSRAEAAVRQREVRSPIDGLVIRRLHGEGALVEEGPLLELAQVRPVYVEVLLPAAMLGKVQVGAEATVEPEFPRDGTFKARVKVVDSVLDSASGTFGVRLEYGNETDAVRPGLECRVRFTQWDGVDSPNS
jgi:RND family efflux transporter MFP subunit